jgi:hypothetical protein
MIKMEETNIPYGSEVTFYANERSKRIIIVRSVYSKKGWSRCIVGDHTKNTRNPTSYIRSTLNQYYPGYKQISLFSETNYHSSKSKGENGKITNYGTHDYNLQYSSYSPMGNFRLEQPIKSEYKQKFGKIMRRVNLLRWNYIVLAWIPDDQIKLQIRHSIHTPFDDKKTIYKSKIYKLSEKDKAIRDFKKYVSYHMS